MRGHCFVNGVEKHVKCAYVGVNGKAQYIMKPPGVIKYGGSVEELSYLESSLAATTIGNYALFAGITVDAYDRSLTRTSPTTLGEAKYGLAATTVGNYALFGGGSLLGSDYSSAVDAYDRSLTRTTATDLSKSRTKLASTAVGDYALFGGGNNIYDTNNTFSTVDAYDRSLTRTTSTSLSVGRSNLTATTIGNYALFGGGYNGNDMSDVDAYTISDGYIP